MAPIVKLLEGQLGPAVTSAAADAVRAIALNNDANKTALREAWALPQLVKLLLPEVGGRTPPDALLVLQRNPLEDPGAIAGQSLGHQSCVY